MFDAKLIVNGQEFPIHYKMLSVIASSLPGGQHYAPLAKALLGLGIPSITENLIGNAPLSMEDMDAIWEKGNLDLRRRLADEDAFRRNLTDFQAEGIITMNDAEILKSMANYAEQLYPSKDEEQAMRLSGKMADTLLEFISRHPDDGVCRELAENSQAPVKFRPGFAEMAKKGMRISAPDIDNLTMEDLDTIRNSSLEILKTVANTVEDIKDKQLRTKIIDFLCANHDPAVRLELAENCWAPKSALRRLAEDPDPDVAQAAQNSLKED